MYNFTLSGIPNFPCDIIKWIGYRLMKKSDLVKLGALLASNALAEVLRKAGGPPPCKICREE